MHSLVDYVHIRIYATEFEKTHLAIGIQFSHNSSVA